MRQPFYALTATTDAMSAEQTKCLAAREDGMAWIVRRYRDGQFFTVEIGCPVRDSVWAGDDLGDLAVLPSDTFRPLTADEAERRAAAWA